MKTRDYRFDNAKTILIFLVVLAHMLNTFKDTSCIVYGIYRAVFMFHMPAFIFISGYFAKFNRVKIVFNLGLPLVLVNTLLVLFNRFYFEPENGADFFVSLPAWTMWYLLAMIVYYVSLPMFDTDNKKHQLIILISLVIVSLVSSFDTRVSPTFSVSRILTFAPYFIFGYYCRKDEIVKKIDASDKACRFIPAVGMIVAVIAIVIVAVLNISVNVFYARDSYSEGNYNIFMKLLALVAGVSGIFVLYAIPNKKIPFFSDIGANTLPIYCLHGFIVRILQKEGFFTFPTPVNILLSFVLAAAIISLLGNKYVARAFTYVFTAKPLSDRLLKKK